MCILQPLIGRSERCNNSNSVVDYMPPKTRAILTSGEHRSAHPNSRINS